MKILRVDPYSGLSGDMFLGALVSLVGDSRDLVELPKTLALSDVEIDVKLVVKNGISATKVDIIDKSTPICRHLSDILGIVDNSTIPARAKELSREIFTVLGEAEAQVHGTSIDKVHFHEVGAIDSILDIVGTSLLLSKLGEFKVHSSPVCTGFGTVKCAHGELPVPAPATLKLLFGMPTYPGSARGEMVTPTGAAILKVLDPDFNAGTVKFEKSAFGAGKKDLENRANCLRISIGESTQSNSTYIIQTNIDDMSGELLGDAFQKRLFESGALDVTISQIIMKKGRPGVKLEILAEEKNLQSISDMVLNETSTFGVRYFKVDRQILERKFNSLSTKYGDVSIKIGLTPSGTERKVPEYEDMRLLSEKNGVSVQEIYSEVLKNI